MKNKEGFSKDEEIPIANAESENEFLHEFREMTNAEEGGEGIDIGEETEECRNEKSKGRIPDYEVLFDEESDKKGGGTGIFKRLFARNFKEISISTFLHVIKAAATWVTPVVTANIINYATNPSDESARMILINAIVALVVILQNIPTHILYSGFTDRMLRTIGAGLRNTLIKKLQHLSLTYHKEIETGRIQSKFLRDIEAIEFFNTHFIKSVIPSIIGIIISMVIAVVKSPVVALFFILVVPINVTVVRAFRRKMAKNNRMFRRETESISSKVTSMLEMLPVTKAHGLEKEEILAAEEQIRALYEKGMSLDRTNAYFGSVTWVVSQAMSLVCLGFTSYLALKGRIPVGDIVMYQNFFNSISGNVQGLINIYPELSKGIESVRSVSEIMLSNEVEDNRNKISLRYVHGSVDFDNVYYRYPNTDKDVIKNFSLHVKEGECIAFVGSSGSGKSTVMNMIIGFLKATGGTVSIDGKPIDALNLSDYRHFISVVPQTSILFDGSIRENIMYGLDKIDEARFNKVLDDANIREFLPSLPNGIDTVVGEGGGKLSGGQKQRISIARALIRDPKILILDEATSALDNISEFQVQKAISHLVKERTTFIVAHRLSTIRDADRIVVMENGECVEVGTYDELMTKKGKFYELKNLSDMNVKSDEI